MYEANEKISADTDSFLHFASKRLLKIPIISNPWLIKRLDLDDNHLNSLEGISQFENLERLSIIDNKRLKSFPPEFKKLNKLHTLLMGYVEVNSFDNLPPSVTILSLLSFDKKSDWNILFHLKQILKSNKLKILSIHINQFEKMLLDATTTDDDMNFLKDLLYYKRITMINIEPDRSEIYNQQGEENLPIYDKETIKDNIAIRLNQLTALIEYKNKSKEKTEEEETPFDEDALQKEIDEKFKAKGIKKPLSSDEKNSSAMYLSASTKLSDIVKMNTQ